MNGASCVQGALGVLLGAGLIGGGIASAGPSGGRGIVGYKLIIVDKYLASGRAKITFMAKDRTPGAIHKGVSSAPANLTGVMEVFERADPSNIAVFDLAETGNDQTGTWVADKAKVAKYVNRGASPGAQGAKVVLLKPGKLLKVATKNLGDGDDDHGDGSLTDLDASAITEGETLRVRVMIDRTGNLSPDTHVMCSDFIVDSVRSIAGGFGVKIASRQSTAPADGTCGEVTTVRSAVLEFVTGAAGGTCGEIREGGAAGTILKTLTCGGLDVGGGCFEAGGSCGVSESRTPSGSTTQMNALCVGPACRISARTAVESGASTNCSDLDCQFGARLPMANGGFSLCMRNTFSGPASGTFTLTTGDFVGSFPLTSAITLTGNGAAPCPLCATGLCDGSSANPGAACLALNGFGDNYECIPAGVPLASFPMPLTPISTNTEFKDTSGADPGIFCPGQDDVEPGSRGCFDSGPTRVCDYIEERGSKAGPTSIGGGPAAATLASVFCIPSASNGLVDGALDIPGPGAISLPGTLELR